MYDFCFYAFRTSFLLEFAESYYHVINIIRNETLRKLFREAWMNVRYVRVVRRTVTNFRDDATWVSDKCGFSGRARFRNGACGSLKLEALRKMFTARRKLDLSGTRYALLAYA